MFSLVKERHLHKIVLHKFHILSLGLQIMNTLQYRNSNIQGDVCLSRRAIYVHIAIFSDMFSKTAWPFTAIFHVEHPWVGEQKVTYDIWINYDLRLTMI